jgi:hypothetical protein
VNSHVYQGLICILQTDQGPASKERNSICYGFRRAGGSLHSVNWNYYGKLRAETGQFHKFYGKLNKAAPHSEISSHNSQSGLEKRRGVL